MAFEDIVLTDEEELSEEAYEELTNGRGDDERGDDNE